MTNKGAMLNLLRRAWDTIDTFKQAYPENWHEEDQAVLDDLIKADNAIASSQDPMPLFDDWPGGWKK